MVSVVVVGASTAGLSAAAELSRNGIDVTLLEEKTVFKCSPADTVINFMAKKCNVSIPSESIIHRVKGFRIISPSGHVLLFRSPGIKFDRAVFDEKLIAEIKGQGGRVFLDCKVIDVEQQNERIAGVKAIENGRERWFDCDILVVASGFQNPWLKSFGCSSVRYPDQVAYGYQVDIDGVTVEADFFDFFLSHRFAPGWKAAISPFSDSKCSAGVYVRGVSPDTVKDFFREFQASKVLGERVSGGKIVQEFFGLDPIATVPCDLVCGNVVFVGCSAGQSGVAYGMAAGVLAAKVISSFSGDVGILRRYERLWKKSFQKDFVFGRLALDVLDDLSDKEIDCLFQVFVHCGFSFRGVGDFVHAGGCLFGWEPKLFFRVCNYLVRNYIRLR